LSAARAASSRGGALIVLNPIVKHAIAQLRKICTIAQYYAIHQTAEADSDAAIRQAH